MPIPIWVISSWCEWYMNVPCCFSVNSYTEGLAAADRPLAETGNAVHATREDDAVPVDAGQRGQAVGDEDGTSVPLDGLNHRAVYGPVVPPAVGTEAARIRDTPPRQRGGTPSRRPPL